jgi:hypothetical protein
MSFTYFYITTTQEISKEVLDKPSYYKSQYVVLQKNAAMIFKTHTYIVTPKTPNPSSINSRKTELTSFLSWRDVTKLKNLELISGIWYSIIFDLL